MGQGDIAVRAIWIASSVLGTITLITSVLYCWSLRLCIKEVEPNMTCVVSMAVSFFAIVASFCQVLQSALMLIDWSNDFKPVCCAHLFFAIFLFTAFGLLLTSLNVEDDQGGKAIPVKKVYKLPILYALILDVLFCASSFFFGWCFENLNAEERGRERLDPPPDQPKPDIKSSVLNLLA